MRIDIITVLPEMLEGFVHESILARAEKKGLAEIMATCGRLPLRRLGRHGDAV